MLKTYFLLFLMVAGGLFQVQAQSYWTDVALSRTEDKSIQTRTSRGLQLNRATLEGLLANAPLENNQGTSGFRIDLPAPNGVSQAFFVYEISLMEAPLAQRFPEIKTYRGYSADGRSRLAMSLTPLGWHVMVIAPEGQWFIDPIRVRQHGEVYQSYFRKDFIPNPAKRIQQQCGFDQRMDPNYDQKVAPQTPSLPSISGARVLNGGTRKTYRIAVAATGEYTAFFGGTVALGQAAIVTSINRVSAVYEIELAVRFTLVANNSSLVYTNATTDPFNNTDAATLIGQSQTTITSIIGAANYDVGHTFSTGAGGLASLGIICNNTQKARGVTGSPAPVGDPYDIDYVAHEIGHQFGANHTFNGSQGSCTGGNRNASTAYEPGSGTTIMAYAGICGTDDLASNSNAYFHIASLREIYNHITTGSGSTCPTSALTGNTPPNFVVSHVESYTIPPSTPFELVGRGADVNNDALTYCWEQYDLGAAGSPTAPSGTMPHFRSFSPTTNPVRSFPRLSDVLANATSLGEVMVNYSRALNFRLTVRDNRTGGGGIVFMDSNLTVNVSTTSSAFSISNLNSTTTLQAGSSFNLTWNAGTTASAPFNAANVMVLFSADGGINFTDTLLASTPNDGSQTITIPNTLTATGRIKVKAVGNVFYDINNANFSVAASVANALTTGAVSASVCSGSSFNLPFTATGTFNASNVFTAQLSNASGSFASAVTIGSLSSTSSGSINVTIPANTVVGTGYRIRVIASSPSLVGTDNGTNINIISLTSNSLPHSQNFNSLSAGAIPTGWVVENAQTTSDFAVNGGLTVNHGNGNTPGLAGNLWTSNTSVMATMPAFGPITTNSRFSFDYRVVNWTNYPNTATVLSNLDSLLLEASPDCGVTWITLSLVNGATHSSSLSFRTLNINLNNPSLVGNNVQFRFRGVWSTGDYWWDIDNISLINVPLSLSSVTPIANLCTGNPISANFTTGVTFNTGNVFRLELSDATGSFATPTLLNAQTATNLSSLSGIVPIGTPTGTGYRVRIVSTNPAATSDSSTTISIINRGLSALPLNENFDNVPQATVPVGWEAEASSTFDFRVDGNPTFAHGVGGTRGMAGNLWTSNPTVALALPRLGPIYPGSKISFDYRLVNFSGYTTTQVATTLGANDTVAVEVSTDCGLSWTRIHAITQANHTTSLNFLNKTVSLDSYVGQNIIVRFFGRWGSGDYWWDIDNVSVTDGGPIVIDTVLSSKNWCNGQSITVNYTLPGTFPSSNVLSLEISDRNGNFTPGTALASVNGMGTGSITATLPNGLPAGHNYKLRLISSFLSMVGTPSNQSFVMHPAFSGTVSQTSTTTTACAGQTIGFTATANFATADVPGVSYFPYAPSRGDSIIIYYSNPTATSAILHWAVNGWTGPDPAYIPAGSSTIQHPAVRTNMTALGGGRFRVAIGPFNNPAQVVTVMDFAINYFQGTNDFWENNNAQDYHVEVSNGLQPSFLYKWKLQNVTASQGSPTFSSNSFVNNDSVWVIASLNNVCSNVDSIASNKTKLTINPNLTPSVSIQASSSTFCAGTLVSFTATPTHGGPSPSYQWRVNGNPVGTNSSTFSTNSLANNDVVSLVLTANNTCQTTATATSNNITVTVNPNLTPTVTISTANTTLCSGVNATFNAIITNGGPNPSFQWKVNGNNVGSNNSSYSNAALLNGDVVSVVLTANNTCQTSATANSNSLNMTINPLLVPSVSIAASSSSICSGTNVTFTATPLNGGSTPVYQWKLNGNNVGTNSATYANNALSNGDLVTLVMTANNTCQTTSTANSNVVTMVVNPVLTPDVSISASANPACSGANVTFTATPVNGGGSPSYQWMINGNPAGTNAATFSSNSLTNNAVVRVILTANNTCQTKSTDTSNSIIMTIQTVVTPSVSIATANTTICQGTLTSFTATPVNGGSNPSFQWRLNGNPVGTNSSTYSNNSLVNGDVVTVNMTASNACQTTNSVSSNSLAMTVTPIATPTVSISANANPICSGDAVIFSSTVQQGGSSPLYQWTINGNPAGAGTSLSSSTLVQGDSVKLTITANNTCQSSSSAVSNTVVMTVNPRLTPSVSIATANLAVCNGTNITFTATPVNGGSNPSYQWKVNGNPAGTNSSTYTSSNWSNNDLVTVTLTANNACQTSSTANSNSLQVQLLQASSGSINRTICSGQSFFFNGNNLTSAGTYRDTLVNAVGCDSILTLTLQVNQPSSASINANICNGQAYNFYGNLLTSAGTYRDTLINVAGCDSIVTLTLNVRPTSLTNIHASICSGAVYNFNGMPLTATGTYRDTLQNVAGCDSVIVLSLNVNAKSNTNLQAGICPGSVYNFNGTPLTSAGTYSDTLVNAAGCDSIITLTLNVTPVLQSSQQASICAGNSFNFNGMMLTTAGTYRDTLQNTAGCDSLIITLTLNVNAVTNGNISASICQGQTYPFNNLQLTSTGTYRDTLVNVNGCDSILTLTLTVNPVPAKPVITRNGNDLSSSAATGNQWYLVGTGAIAGATGQVYTPNQANGGRFYVISTVNGCSSPSSDTLDFVGTGIVEASIFNWQYFPNPAGQLVNIRLELAKADQIRIDITDLSGRIVRSVYEGERTPGILNLEVPVSDLAQGLYLIRLSGQKEQKSGRLLIQR